MGRFVSVHRIPLRLRLCRYAGLLALSVMGSPWLNRGKVTTFQAGCPGDGRSLFQQGWPLDFKETSRS